jgi:hypothetical protein
MQSLLTALLAIAASAVMASSGSAQSGGPAVAQTPHRACSLLTSEEVKTLIDRGRPSDGPGEEMPVGPGNRGSACAFSGGRQQVILFSGQSSEADFEAVLKAYRHDRDARHPVSGVGERAYIMYPPAQNQYQRPTAFLVARVGTHTLGVVVAAADRQAEAATLLPVAVEVARAAAAKLRSGSS